MEKILIENYRGFDIEFDIESEIFQCVVTEENTKESKSFSAVKKFVDEYKKTNQDFVPFWVEKIPEHGWGENKRLKIIGLRKDQRFVSEDEKGNKNQVSDWDIKDLMLLKEENKPILNEYAELKKEFETFSARYTERKKEILSRVNISTLENYKKELSK